MATSTKTEKAENVDNHVEIFIPKGYGNDDPNYFISVNGKNYLLPRGKKSKVPPEIAYEFERAQRAQQKQDENIDALLEASK